MGLLNGRRMEETRRCYLHHFCPRRDRRPTLGFNQDSAIPGATITIHFTQRTRNGTTGADATIFLLVVVLFARDVKAAASDEEDDEQLTFTQVSRLVSVCLSFCPSVCLSVSLLLLDV